MDELKVKAQAINELTSYDMVMMKSSFEIIHNAKYQCGKCIKKTSEPVREKVLSCSGKKDLNRNAGLFFYNSCPGNFNDPSFGQMLDAHRLFRKGVMASSGGLMDQSSRFIEVMNFIECLVLDREISQITKNSNSKNSRRK